MKEFINPLLVQEISDIARSPRSPAEPQLYPCHETALNAALLRVHGAGAPQPGGGIFTINEDRMFCGEDSIAY